MVKTLWISATIITACVATTGYVLHKHEVFSSSTTNESVISPSSSWSLFEKRNPLLSADRNDIDRWYPHFCFTELYMKDPSYKGGLIKHCTQRVINLVKLDTGIELTESQVRSPEVFQHFKSLLGEQKRWAM